MKSTASSRHSDKLATCCAEATTAARARLDEIYQQQILQHNKHPVGYQIELPQSAGWQHTRAWNPLCGDEIELAVKLSATVASQARQLQALAFSGDSCAICTAAASLLCQQLPGLSAPHALAMTEQFIAFVQAQQALTDACLQPLSIFAQLHSLPNRKNCATLPWQALQDLLATSADGCAGCRPDKRSASGR